MVRIFDGKKIPHHSLIEHESMFENFQVLKNY